MGLNMKEKQADRVSNSRLSVLKKDSAQALSRQFPFSSHALADRRAALPEFFTKRLCAVWDAAAGMEQQPRLRGAIVDREVQGSGCGVDGFHVGAQRPSNSLPVKQIRHDAVRRHVMSDTRFSPPRSA
jgi:hypothetical protein